MNPVAFTIFGLDIYWYGIIMTVAIIVAFFLAMSIMKRIGFRDEIVFEILLIIIPLGFLGARLYFMIFSDTPWSNFFSFRDGGIAIYGAVIAGALGVWIYTRFIRKSSFFAISDIVVIVLILAQCIGRWGNYFNQELYGLKVGFNFFPLTVNIGGSYHLALFFYESVLNLAGFILLYKIFSRQKQYGTTTAVYFIVYGSIRAVLEPLRMSAYQLTVLGIPVSLLVSILCICAGILLLYLGKKGKLSQKDIGLRATKEERKCKKPQKTK